VIALIYTLQEQQELSLSEPSFIPLRLLAQDEEEIHILSAHLQDGLFPLTSMHFEKADKTFSCLVNRFCWEHVDAHPNEDRYYRVHAGLVFSDVLAIHQRGFDQKHPQRILNLLMMSMSEHKNGHKTIHLLFSGDKEVKVEVASIQCRFGDVDHPWLTNKKPTHLHEHLEELEKKTA
jgi:hypothetical protein